MLKRVALAAVTAAVTAALVTSTPAMADTHGERAEKAARGLVAPVQGANDWACKPRDGGRPVIFVHGATGVPGVPADPGPFAELTRKLTEDGHCVFALNHNWFLSMYHAAPNYDDPALDLTVRVAPSTTQLDVFVRGVQHATGADKVHVIAHSLGAPITRSYLKGSGNAARVDDVISLGGPNHGIDANSSPLTLIGCVPLLPACPEILKLDGGRFLGYVNDPEARPGVSYTSIGINEEAWAGNPFVAGESTANVFIGPAAIAGKTDDIFADPNHRYLVEGPHAPRRVCEAEPVTHQQEPANPHVQTMVLAALRASGPLPDDVVPC
ncbi:lipase (class 2) [Herbihabitans rhizosphaerae]|uniref:Lipase (Class 2) n=1 Tax=Herbihabitans rhizosphaerae TaxID=1872711 RepID=A0A4Q7L671_9PSEU|nr:hypothetical protein [Herbihabitans rhizosphaerae]RZS44835.1 lipase (class 2) [Herbihabitans rhizosphaerae]